MEDLKICSFTGHRPSKLPWGYNENAISYYLFKIKLRKIITNTIKQGYNYFISGMALGTDLMCAEIILKLKRKYKNIQLECAIPCKDQHLNWNYKNIEKYEKFLKKADKVTMVSNSYYYNGCMQKRNKYMVNKAHKIIAVFNGSKGGTMQTIQYAQKMNKDILIIDI